MNYRQKNQANLNCNPTASQNAEPFFDKKSLPPIRDRQLISYSVMALEMMYSITRSVYTPYSIS